ncbi:F-box/FBD/LRR-repeat protein-like protein [Tanacetum coccineum]
MDRLSDLPACLIEMILCFIPIQEAGRTSILSREWRYRWTKIPKLVFKENTFQSHERQKMDRRCKLIYAVGQVLLMHDGPIHEFTLSLRISPRVNFDHIITHLSRKTGIKKLKLNFGKARTLQQILSSCPLLKTVFMNIHCSHITRSNGGFTFTELFECLPVIETLYLSFDLLNVREDYIDARVPRELLPTPLFHLKYLSIYDVCFTRREEFIVAFLMKNSPNLEKLKTLDVDFRWFNVSDIYGKFLKSDILSGSPVLKTVRIFPSSDRDKKSQILEIFLGYSRASPELYDF